MQGKLIYKPKWGNGSAEGGALLAHVQKGEHRAVAFSQFRNLQSSSCS